MSLPDAPNGKRLSKRQKIADAAAKRSKGTWRNRNRNTEIPTALICRLPLELLAEALSYLLPIDILALARTSKYFCNTLTGIPAIFIWKRARTAFPLGSIPDPPPTWTESALARFLFDDASCSVCGNKVVSYPVSYSNRVFLCFKNTCRTSYFEQYTRAVDMASSPFTGRLTPFEPTTHPSGFVQHPLPLFSKQAFLEEEKEYLQIQTLDDAAKTAYLEESERYKARAKRIKEWAGLMQIWGSQYWAARQAARQAGMESISAFSKIRGWPNSAIGDSPTLLSLRRRGERSLTPVTVHDLTVGQDAIEADLRHVALSREQAIQSEKLKLIASITKEVFAGLQKRAKPSDIIPTESEFKKLAAISTLYEYDAAVIKDMRDKGLIAKTLGNNLTTWQKETRDAFGALFGHERWISISTTVLHPADRVTALLECQECRSVPERNATIGTLTFRDACSHVCRKSLGKKARGKARWDVSMFRMDEKAVKICRDAVLASENVVETVTMQTMQELGNRFLCKSCPSLIIMDFKSIIGHAKRHEETEVEFIPKQMSDSILKHKIEYGLCHKLQHEARESKPDARRFGCRICGQDSKGRFVFDGLKSHAKAKHGIHTLRDEDFFQIGKT